MSLPKKLHWHSNTRSKLGYKMLPALNIHTPRYQRQKITSFRAMEEKGVKSDFLTENLLGRLSVVSRFCSYFHSNKSRCEKPETGNHAPRTFVNTRFSTKRSSCSLRTDSLGSSSFSLFKKPAQKGWKR